MLDADTLLSIQLWQAIVSVVHSPEEGEQTCPICHKDYDELPFVTSCGHQMHFECLSKCIQHQLQSKDGLAGYCPCCCEPICAICFQGNDVWVTSCRSLRYGLPHNVHRHCLMEGIDYESTSDFSCKICHWWLNKSHLQPNAEGRDGPSADDPPSFVKNMKPQELPRLPSFQKVYEDRKAKARLLVRDYHPDHPLPADPIAMFSGHISPNAQIDTGRFIVYLKQNTQPFLMFRNSISKLELSVSDVLSTQHVSRLSLFMLAYISHFIDVCFHGQPVQACSLAYETATFLMSAAFHTLDEVMADPKVAKGAWAYDNFRSVMERNTADHISKLMDRLIEHAAEMVVEIYKVQG